MATEIVDLGDGFVVEADTSKTTPDQLLKMKKRAMIGGVRPSPIIPAVPEPAASAAPAASTRAGLAPKGKTEPAAKWALDAAPMALGGIGGAIAGTAAIPSVPVTGPYGPMAAGAAGAYLGGNMGELIRQTGYGMAGYGDVPRPLSVESLLAANREGGIQMLNELLGRTASEALSPLALALENASLRLPKNVVKEANMRELGKEAAMPSPAKTALEERVATTKGGHKRALGLLNAESNAAANKFAASEGSGQTFHVNDIAQKFVKDAEKDLGRPLNAMELRRVRGKAKAILDEVATARTHGAVQNAKWRMTASDMEKAKQTLQEWGRGEFGAVANRGKLASADPNDFASLSTGVRDAMVNPNTGIPGIEPVLQRQQKLKGLERAVADARAQSSHLRNWVIPSTTAGMAAFMPGVPGGPAVDAGLAGLLAWLANNRGVQSKMAMGLSHPITADATRQIPRLMEQLLFPPDPFPAPADTTR